MANANRLTDNVITIDLSPLILEPSSDSESNSVLRDSLVLENEIQAHNHVFRWNQHEDDEINNQKTMTAGSSYLNQETTTFQCVKGETTRLYLHGQYQTRTECWTNMKDAVDVSGLPSVQRILLIRDITKRLREVDDKREKDQKIFTGNAFTEIFFKLDSTKFSFRLHPSNNQPGNGFLSMKGTGRTYTKTVTGKWRNIICVSLN